jgi:dolichol-phosphate mannosyltransferase
MNATLSIVIPVFNEAENIGSTLRRIDAGVRTPHEVLVVYDFEADSTVPVVRDLQAELPAVRLHRNEYGRGVLNAMRSGMDSAQAQFILITMADGSDEIGSVDEMVRLATGGAAIVAASRYMPGGRQIGGPLLKRTLSRLAGLSLHHLGRVSTHDATNSFKLYRRDFLESVTVESTGGFELALELTAKATLAASASLRFRRPGTIARLASPASICARGSRSICAGTCTSSAAVSGACSYCAGAADVPARFGARRLSSRSRRPSRMTTKYVPAASTTPPRMSTM